MLSAAVGQYWRVVQSAAAESEIANYRIEWEDGILARLAADPPQRMFRVFPEDDDVNSDLIPPEFLDAVRRDVFGVSDSCTGARIPAPRMHVPSERAVTLVVV